MKNLLILLLLISFSLESEEEIPIKLTIAKTDEERSFGLMQRRSLLENEGMLFVYPKKEYLSFWSFNCFIDFSIAFLDELGFIREIHTLKSYPEKMKNIPPLLNFHELQEFYGSKHPILQFFYDKRVVSSFEASFALEMNKDWFYNHFVSIGDQLKWDEKNASIIRFLSRPK